MVRYKLKKLALASLLGVQLITLTACGGKTASTDTQTAVSQETADQGTNTTEDASANTADQNTNMLYGEVTAVNGSDVTISVGTLNENASQPGRKGPGSDQSGDQKGGGQPPEQQSGDERAPGKGQSQDKAGAPVDEQSGDQQSGETPKMPSMLTLTGEEKTITISDESVITSNTPDSSTSGLSAVTVGSTIAITYAEDGTTISKVEVMGAQGGPGGAAPNQSTDSSEAN